MKKILVVDDEPFIVRSLTYVLQKQGYETFSAQDGLEALQILKKVKPDLIFLDVMMPKLSGYEACERIREIDELKDIPIIMLTAKGQEKDRVRGLESGADQYLTKPFSPSKIVEQVRDIFKNMES